MALLRSITSLAGVYDPNAEVETFENRLQISIKLISQIPTIVAAIHRVRQGLEPVEPDPELCHAGNFMYMINGEKPSEDATRAMDLIPDTACRTWIECQYVYRSCDYCDTARYLFRSHQAPSVH